MNVTTFFERHHQALYRYLERFCGDADLAADAAQETFVRLFERPPAGEPEVGWLYRVATNIVRDDQRGRVRHVRLLAGGESRAPLADPPPDAHALVEGAARRDAVSAALATLSEKERTALLMREEGYAHREIAAALDTTTGSVGTLIARALDRLSERMNLDPEHL